MNGTGVTATGLNLTAGPPAYEIAVDPTVVPLQTFAHVQPNPFGTSRAFYAGDTGGAIIGRHVDIYDWKGRADQNAWGVRHVNVTPAPNPGSGNLLQEITPGPTATASPGQVIGTAGWTPTCDRLAATATLATVPGQTARILADRTAAAPTDAPAAVKLAIAAANEIHAKSYPEPVAHFGSLSYPWPAYDCSGAVSFVLYSAGLHSQRPDVSGTLESWGFPGPGTWITVYANSGHTWIVIAGLAFDTADYGGPNIPAGSGPRWRQDPLGNLADGLTYVTRHPPDYDSRLVHPHELCLSRARVRARRTAVTLAALLVAGEIAGCAGIANPYQTNGTATRTTSTLRATTPADADDPTPERNGTVPPHQQAAIDRLSADAARTSPQVALTRYAALYVNWTAAGVAANQRRLAAISLGQARAQALQAAASLARDPELTKSAVSNTGTVVAIAPGQGAAAGLWVVVTREQTTGKGDCAGLPPTLHVIYAQLTRTPNGLVVIRWQPEN